MLAPSTIKFIQACKQNGLDVNIDQNEIGQAHKHIQWNLTSNDGRYENLNEAAILETFIRNKAIDIQTLIIDVSWVEIEALIHDNMALRCSSVQQAQKAIMTIALAKEGYTNIEYEQDVYVGKADVIAQKGPLEIVGECSMCRIDKVGHTLAASEGEKEYHLWHLPTWCYHGDIRKHWWSLEAERGDSVPVRIYIYKRGANWSRLVDIQRLAFL